MRTPADRHEGRRAPILSSLSPGALADRLGVSAAAVVSSARSAWWQPLSGAGGPCGLPTGPDPAEILPMAGSVPIPGPGPAHDRSAPEPAVIVVDVVGAVLRPGVHELPAFSRVADAIDAAGGFTADADRVRLNLAEPLDGRVACLGAGGRRVDGTRSRSRHHRLQRRQPSRRG